MSSIAHLCNLAAVTVGIPFLDPKMVVRGLWSVTIVNGEKLVNFFTPKIRHVLLSLFGYNVAMLYSRFLTHKQ